MTKHLGLQANKIQINLGYFQKASQSYTEIKQPTCRSTEIDLINAYSSNIVKS